MINFFITKIQAGLGSEVRPSKLHGCEVKSVLKY